eukprot:s2555_g2.t1
MESWGGGWSSGLDPNTKVFVCDLAPRLQERIMPLSERGCGCQDVDLRKVFGFYGDIVSLEHIDEASGGSALITYSTKEAAQEAVDIVLGHQSFLKDDRMVGFAEEELLRILQGLDWWPPLASQEA